MGAGRGRNRRSQTTPVNEKEVVRYGHRYFPRFHKPEWEAGSVALYADEQADRRRTSEEEPYTTLIQQIAAFPIKDAGSPFREHIVLTDRKSVV